MDPVQARMARAALAWDVPTLAARAGVTPDAVSRLESGLGAGAFAEDAVRYAFEQAGIAFIAADEAAGPGVRLRTAGARDEGLRPDQLNAENDG